MKKSKREPIPREAKAFIMATLGNAGVILSCVVFLFVGIFDKLWMNWIIGGAGLCIFLVSMVTAIDGWYKMGQYSVKDRDD